MPASVVDNIERPEVEGKTIMDPMPGEKYVEYSKDGADGDRKSKVDSGLDIERKPGHGNRIYLAKVQHPAPAHNLAVGDRLVALNDKKIEDYPNLDAIRDEFATKNVVRMVVDPTMLR
ncbi:hypothetical protein IV203_021660 [Nitzschia inconspicua]|uniref:PDZ domain-containing protein n=1 Tax=Nitzschia inconspicua TaxID=303405 RepID=A0A9K3KH61_9STRA|nr:hypothetical protein IV203_021660 [Nitzschia inconspicua]